MKTAELLKKLLVKLPSVVMAVIFIQNGLTKVFNSGQLDKVIKNQTVLILVGVLLLIATCLFLFQKTLLIGTVFLSLYMCFIVCVHLYKGKPIEVTALIIVATIFAAYLRKPELFYQDKLNTQNH
ncbi:hypothetical protein GCM10011416_11880 [Polaribacter pacificus]|uniref:DoxX-like family protein n=1 Tax=Polaribacter pacificus TaxID=1775173 RepID=A0A917HXF3_9FLAO|nr:hypothetical protein [Polaribacter pacificus]GGG95834.1 hypothetical protein GCM10011416_11880 [Polaribacter pacificus]